MTDKTINLLIYSLLKQDGGLMIDTTPRYVIEGSVKDEVWTLYSIVATNFGGDAKNYICDGSFQECSNRMTMLKALDDLAKQAQELGIE